MTTTIQYFLHTIFDLFQRFVKHGARDISWSTTASTREHHCSENLVKTYRIMETGKRLLEYVYPRRVKQRLVFDGPKASLEGFEAMWKTDCDSDLTQAHVTFSADGFVRKEYIEIFDLIKEWFEKNSAGEFVTTGTALVRGSSGVGKSAFLQYLLARIKDAVKNVLVVRGSAENSAERTFLHLSTNWLGWKTAVYLASKLEARMVEKYCEWTLVDGCDWEPYSRNCTVGAASPSTPWKGFRLQFNLLQICMPPWSLDQLELCRQLSPQRRRKIDEDTLQENYRLVGGIARWALGTTADALDQVDSAVKGVNFSLVQSVMATQHATKNDEKELVHRLVLWTVGRDGNGRWLFEISSQNPIHYSLLTNFVGKKLSEKAATLTIQKRKALISELKEEGAASAYRGVIFEADAIDRLVRGGSFTLHKCSNVDDQSISLTLTNTVSRFPMKSLESLDVFNATNRIVVPDARNFESVDAFLVILNPPKKEVLLFQTTVGKSHPTKYDGVKQVMDKIREKLKDKTISCKLVFVVPDDVKDCYGSPQAVLNKDGTVCKRQERDLNESNQFFVSIEYT